MGGHVCTHSEEIFITGCMLAHHLLCSARCNACNRSALAA